MEGEREIFKTEMKWEKSLLSPTHTHKKKKKSRLNEQKRLGDERSETKLWNSAWGCFTTWQRRQEKKKK